MVSDVEARLAVIERDQQEFKTAVVGINKNLETLVRLEERHAETRKALDRAFTECEKLDNRVSAIEKKMPGLVETRGWILAGMLATLGIVGLALVGLVVNTRENHAAHVAPPPAAPEPRRGGQ